MSQTLDPIPYKEMLRIMIVENKNEIQKSEIMERMIGRQQIAGKDVKIMQGQTQAKIRALKEALKDLEEFYQEEVDKEKAAEVKSN